MVADLIDCVDGSPTGGCARCWPPRGCTRRLFTLRGGTNEVLRGVVAQGHGGCAVNELAQLVDDIGRRSFDARLGHRGVPDDLRRGAVAQSGGHRAGPADQQPGRRTRGGGDRVVRLGKPCGRGSDRRDRSARGVAGGQGRRRRARQRARSRSRSPTPRERRPDQRNRARCAMAASAPSCWRHGPPTRCMSRARRRATMSTATTSPASRAGRSRSI